MARFGSFVLVFLVLFASVVPSLEARKLLINTESKNVKVPSLFKSLVLSALPKGKVPASAPSKKTHATLDNEQLFARHLAGIDRILRSVPSPGIGH
ncbi:putative B-cell lymphoma 6 protein [Melia azedarach]|uniref:B-cell lymphoma 6 protein n=1 Tax=Melia azedarach TaxID=155640 RepID=A0ACC1WZ05_MELAZ|nr:putative B-cell lymphoma 6 protein [Melia azedarach]